MRFNSVGFAVSVGMALVVVLIGFTLLSAAGLAGFAAQDASSSLVENQSEEMLGCGVVNPPAEARPLTNLSEAEAKTVAAGDALFKGNCAQCHAVNELVVGPALAGITRRRPMSWILPWVKNSGKLVASGDDYAVALFNKFDKQQMPSFALSNKEIQAIVAYIESQQAVSVAYTNVTVSCR